MNRNLADGLNYLSKWNARKVLNATKLIASYLYAKFSRKAIHWGMPLSISIEPTTSCNLRCPECPSGLRSFTRPTGMLNEKLYHKTIDELKNSLTYLLFYFQGEPYLHPNFLDMVKYAADQKIYTATSTNAHYLSDTVAKQTVESGLDRLIISIDGTSQETYAAYRIGGKLEKVLSGTRNIIKWKKALNSKTPHIIFQFLVVKPNQHQLNEIHTLAKEIGVDEVGLKTAQIYDFKNGSPLIPTVTKYSRYKKLRDGTFEIKNKLENHCWKMWHSCVITWDGKVVPCCFDKDAHYQLGNIDESTFSTFWKSPVYNDFRASVLHSRNNIEMCKNCTEGTKIWA